MPTTFLAKVLAFDLDGTIAISKTPISSEMAEVLSNLLKYTRLSIISGSSFEQMKSQVVDVIDDILKNSDNSSDGFGASRTLFSNFVLFPNNGDAMYTWDENILEFKKEYEDLLSAHEKKQIIDAFDEIFEKYQLPKQTQYGPAIEDRGGQITFSALGQNAPISLKAPWDPDQKKRSAMKAILDPKLQHFDISIGGATSIDVTRKGINKAGAVRKLLGHLAIDTSEVLFFGDALFPGGNDSSALETGVKCIAVKDPQDTLMRLRVILQQYKVANVAN